MSQGFVPHNKVLIFLSIISEFIMTIILILIFESKTKILFYNNSPILLEGMDDSALESDDTKLEDSDTAELNEDSMLDTAVEKFNKFNIHMKGKIFTYPKNLVPTKGL